jgi:hypothetical protein
MINKKAQSCQAKYGVEEDDGVINALFNPNPNIIDLKQPYTEVSESNAVPDTVNAPFCISFYPLGLVSMPPSHSQLVVASVITW